MSSSPWPQPKRLSHLRSAGLGIVLVLSASTTASAVEQLQFPDLAPERELLDVLEYVHAETNEDVVVSATKKAQAVEDAPAIIEVVSARQIRDRGYQSISDALRAVAGVAILDDLVYLNLGVRGVYAASGSSNDTIKVMINSQPVAFRSTSESFLGPELLPIQAVKRIEVMRGPASALYGANAFLGIVNVITWTGEEVAGDVPWYGEATANGYMNSANSKLDGGPTLVLGGRGSDYDLFVAGTFNYADRSGLQIPGYDDMAMQIKHKDDPLHTPSPRGYPSPGLTVQQRTAWFRARSSKGDLERVGSAYALGRYTLNPTSKLSLEGNLQVLDRYGEWQYLSVLSHGTRLTYLNWYLRGSYAYTGLDGHLVANVSLSFTQGRPLASERILDPANLKVFRRRKFGSNAVDVVASAEYTPSDVLSLQLAVDYSLDAEKLLRVETVDIASGRTSLGPGYRDRNFQNLGALLQGIFTPQEWLTLTVGSRADYNNVVPCNTERFGCFGHRADPRVADLPVFDPNNIVDNVAPVLKPAGTVQLSNRVGLVLKAPFLGMYAKALYGGSYKPPSIFQMYHYNLVSGNLGTAGSPAVPPESAHTVEAEIGMKPSEAVHLSADIFFTQVYDALFVLEAVAHSQKIRPADLQLAGIELNMSWRPLPELVLWANASCLVEDVVTTKRYASEPEGLWQTSSENAQFPGPRYPQVMAHAGLDTEFPTYFLRGALSVHYIGSRTAALVNAQSQNAVGLNRPYAFNDYLLADLAVSTSGVKFVGAQETRVSLSVRGFPGNYITPGDGGVDIPSLGSRIYLQIAQEL